MKIASKGLGPALVMATALAGVAVLPAVAQREGGAGNASQAGFVTNIVSATNENTDFRRVLHTGDHLQLVVMTLQAGQDIGLETHDDGDQFLRIESGTAVVRIGNEEHRLEPGSVAIFPAGVAHNVANAGSEPLHLYTIYTPPEHPAGTVHAAKPAE